jgi:2-C-methyl-D-erythritol 2,4-cyclodiphosphate synthase
MDSQFFLKEVTRMAREQGWRIGNVDCTICLEAPKINPHIPTMKHVLAPLMDIDEGDVSIKATTSETLGYVGREEGVNACAVVLIMKHDA